MSFLVWTELWILTLKIWNTSMTKLPLFFFFPRTCCKDMSGGKRLNFGKHTHKEYKNTRCETGSERQYKNKNKVRQQVGNKKLAWHVVPTKAPALNLSREDIKEKTFWLHQFPLAHNTSLTQIRPNWRWQRSQQQVKNCRKVLEVCWIWSFLLSSGLHQTLHSLRPCLSSIFSVQLQANARV